MQVYSNLEITPLAWMRLSRPALKKLRCVKVVRVRTKQNRINCLGLSGWIKKYRFLQS